MNGSNQKRVQVARQKSGWVIQALRINRGWSQRALAEAIGLSPATIQNAEKGERISELSQKTLADEFGMEPLDIWPRETQRIYV